MNEREHSKLGELLTELIGAQDDVTHANESHLGREVIRELIAKRNDIRGNILRCVDTMIMDAIIGTLAAEEPTSQISDCRDSAEVVG